MDIRDKVDKDYEKKSFSEIAASPASALQGVSEGDGAKLKEAFGIDNIREMANLKYFKMAKQIKSLAEKE